MGLSTHDGDMHVKGRLSAESLSPPSNSITDAAVASDAGIQATKLQHQHRPTYQQEATANAVAEEKVIHVARAAGTVQAFEVGLITPPDTLAGSGGRTAIVDLKKNGVSILTATVTLNSTATAYVVQAATISSSAYVDGDVFTVAVTLGAGSTGTHAKGVFAQATLHEAA